MSPIDLQTMSDIIVDYAAIPSICVTHRMQRGHSLDLPEVRQLLLKAWPAIVEECRAVLGGELHYQAVVYHCLRQAGCPRTQLGMNVKQWIVGPVSKLFQEWDLND